MKKKFLYLSALALSFVLFQSPAALASHEPCGCAAATHKVHEVIKDLDLTKDQKDKIKKIMDQARDGLKAKHHESHDVRMLINSSFKNDTITEPKIDEFVNKEQQIIGAMLKIRMMERYELAKVLTTEQKAKLNLLFDKWMKAHARPVPGLGPHKCSSDCSHDCKKEGHRCPHATHDCKNDDHKCSHPGHVDKAVGPHKCSADCRHNCNDDGHKCSHPGHGDNEE
jgi:Spy/CpxP family protein refolding chaperone